MNVIAVTKDSYKYWSSGNYVMTRLSAEAKGVIYSDALGAVYGIFRGFGRAAGSLVFGPGGPVLTVAGSIIVSAARSSIDAAIVAGLIRIF
ncbi:hypothetical protein [uncultured Bacteroides sp.]|uniref:hypothetical protein n=1 Tax=uncultured Bacteroides sp. TaxID=162156 RepID=UPI0025E35CB4|nr:hypothetical protein [uncultured Bacteroides sp.]